MTLNTTLKKHIKLLSELYDHSIDYNKNTIILNSRLNNIRITQINKTNIELTFNINSEKQHLIIQNNDCYDILIKLMKRNESYLCPFGDKSMKFILPIDFLEEEMNGATELDLKKLILSKSAEYVDLGGNRFEGLYYKGVLILTDDLLWSKFNMVDFDIS